MLEANKMNDLDSVCFILNEIARYGSMSFEERRQTAKQDAFCYLPHPDRKGFHLTCGRAAYNLSFEMAERIALASGLVERVSKDDLARELRRVISFRFLRERRPVTRSEVDRAMSSAVRIMKGRCGSITHFIPCRISSKPSNHSVAVGPVRFIPIGQFRGRLAVLAKGWRKGTTDAERRFDRELFMDARTYYTSFDCVAELTISDCDEKTSARRAMEVVRSAVDSLLTLFGPRAGSRMTVAGPNHAFDRRGSFRVDSNGLSVSTEANWIGGAFMEDDWATTIATPDFSVATELIGLSLRALMQPEHQLPLARRFIDATFWFGEAVREVSAPAKIIKYVTAVERMVMTDEKDDITRLFCDRVAALCFQAPSMTSYNAWRSDAHDLYSLRSKLVHGSLSPSSRMVLDGVSLAERISEHTISSALAAFGRDGLESPMSNRKLARWFAGLYAWVDEIVVRDPDS